jgi:hypothetical protein
VENPGETAFGMRDLSGTLPPFGSRILSKFSHARPRLVFAIFPILILGAALRLMGIDHDLPFQYDPDEPIFVGGAIRMLYNRDMDPQWYGAPASTTMDLLAASYTAMYAAGRVSGEFRNPRDFRNYFHSHPTPFILAGRLISFIAGTALILFVFLPL